MKAALLAQEKGFSAEERLVEPQLDMVCTGGVPTASNRRTSRRTDIADKTLGAILLLLMQPLSAHHMRRSVREAPSNWPLYARMNATCLAKHAHSVRPSSSSVCARQAAFGTGPTHELVAWNTRGSVESHPRGQMLYGQGHSVSVGYQR